MGHPAPTLLDAHHISMPAWGGQDIDREKTVFVWPSGTARAEKTDMINVTFTPGMTEKQVKTLLTREFDLDCDADDIVGLVDGYSQLCECLGDIAGNRKGYHIRYRDERSVELSQLRKENAELKKQIQAAGGSSGGSDAAELRRLRNENEKLNEENAKLKNQIDGGSASASSAPRRGSSDAASNNSAAAAPKVMSSGIKSKMPASMRRGAGSRSGDGPSSDKQRDARRENLAERSNKLMPAKPNPLNSPAEPAAAKKSSGGAAAEAGNRVQDLPLPEPTDTSTGCDNYVKLQKHWLRGCEDEELPVPDYLEDHVDDLILSERPQYVREAVPLACLIDALATQWMTDNVL